MKTILLKSTLKKVLLLAFFGIMLSSTSFGQYFWPDTQTFSILEPEDIVYNISWGSESSIDNITYYYYDELDTYQEVVLNSGTDYSVDGDELTIYQTWIEGMSPESGDYYQFFADFNLGNISYFYIDVYQTLLAGIYEDEKSFDLSNPSDVFGTIYLSLADELTSVMIGTIPVDEANYTINGDWLIFDEAYLGTLLTSAGNSVDFEVYFDNGDSDTFTVSAVMTGVAAAELSQTEFDLDQNTMPEYIETIITWNSASTIDEMYVTYADGGYPDSELYEEYTITPINAQTATLRIILGGDKANNEKVINYFYVSIQIHFDTGIPANLFLGIFSEYYIVEMTNVPWNGGNSDGSGGYYVDEEVTLEAYPEMGYTFVKWLFDDDTEITDNPYTFNMPSHDIAVHALFLSDYPEVLSSSPENWDGDIDPNASIYVTFDREIMEGTSMNGFADITLIENGTTPWTITDFSIINGNILVIDPAEMNINTSYYLTINPEAIEDAANPGLSMEDSFTLYFTIGLGDYVHGVIDPDTKYYSLDVPEDVVFDISWGEDTYFNDIVHYYWDDFDVYQELTLMDAVDYTIVGSELTITNTFISGMMPEAGDEMSFFTSFESGYYENFYINVLESTDPELNPAAVNYDLSNPANIITNIVFNDAQTITSVSVSSVDLVEGTDYLVDGTWLIIEDSYLSTHLSLVDDVIVLEATFNTSDVAELTVTAIQSGLTYPTIDPQFGEYSDNNFPELLDITITWNDASSVSTLFVWVEEDGVLDSFEYPYYEVIPIDSESAILRIDLTEGGKSTNNLKTIETFNASIEIVFDIAFSEFYYLTITEEYYEITTNALPIYGGTVTNDDQYNVGESVELEAYANTGYEFQNWRVDGAVVSTEAPYIFDMPNHDIEITAHFVELGTTLYTIELSGLPIDGGLVTGAGEFEEGEEVTILATPNTGFTFDNWTDDLSAEFAVTAEYTFTMPAENLVLTANFRDISSVEQNVFANQSIYPNPFSDFITISNPETVETIIFTNITGQVVSELSSFENGQINTSELANGFYLMVLVSENGDRLVKKVLKQ